MLPSIVNLYIEIINESSSSLVLKTLVLKTGNESMGPASIRRPFRILFTVKLFQSNMLHITALNCMGLLTLRFY